MFLSDRTTQKWISMPTERDTHKCPKISLESQSKKKADLHFLNTRHHPINNI